MLLVSLVITAFFQLFSLNTQVYDNTRKESMCINYCEDGLLYLKDNFHTFQYNQPEHVNLYPENEDYAYDTLELRKQKWGLFDLLSSTSVCRGSRYQLTALAGTSIKDKTALFLANSTFPLKLAGNTKITGDCILPLKGVERANIFRSGYTGDKLIYGTYKKEKASFPKFRDELRTNIMDFITASKGSFNPSAEFLDLSELDTLINSFKDPLLWIDLEGYTIDFDKVQGHVVIYAKDSIHVEAEKDLDKVILVAPLVRFKKGFTGNVQVLAKRAIIAEEDVHLSYPSVLAVMQTSFDEDSIRINIGENSSVFGSILSVAHESSIKKHPHISLGVGTTVIGEVISDGYLEARGTVKGRVITRYFKLSSEGSDNINVLHDAVIDRSSLPQKFCGIPIFEESKKRENEIQFLSIF